MFYILPLTPQQGKEITLNKLLPTETQLRGHIIFEYEQNKHHQAIIYWLPEYSLQIKSNYSEQDSAFTSKIRILTIVIFLDETEKEIKPVDSVQCPSPVLSTPWIPFQNCCYNFMIGKTKYQVATPDEAHSKCQNLSKYLIWSLHLFIKKQVSPECVINMFNQHQ